MEKTDPHKYAIAMARIAFLAAVRSRYNAMSAAGKEVTRDDLATHIEAELWATAEARGPISKRRPDPPQPPQSPAPMRAVVPFFQTPRDHSRAA